MKTNVLNGSKQEIAANLVRISGEVREAIVFIKEPTSPTSGADASEAEDFFAECNPSWLLSITDSNY